MCEVWFVVVWCQDCFFFSILGLLLLFFVAVYWSTGWFRALLEAHLVKISPSTFRELTQHREKQDMLAQALSQWANISFLLMALQCQIPVLNSFYWSSKPVDCVTVADTVCIWGHYFFFQAFKLSFQVRSWKKNLSRNLHSGCIFCFHTGRLLNSGHFYESLRHISELRPVWIFRVHSGLWPRRRCRSAFQCLHQ